MLHWQGLVRLQGWYWHYTSQQARTMADDSKRISAEVYRSFFVHTLDLSSLPAYSTVNIPMLALCGSREIKAMKESLALLAENPHCRTIQLQCVNHDFPMRHAQTLNPLLRQFIAENLKLKI